MLRLVDLMVDFDGTRALAGASLDVETLGFGVGTAWELPVAEESGEHRDHRTR